MLNSTPASTVKGNSDWFWLMIIFYIFLLIYLIGVGLILEELKNSGHLDDTLIIYSSDNGIPFPNGRTNVYDSGLAEPLFISSPLHTERQNEVTASLASLLDVVPTLLDWYGISTQYTDYHGGNDVPKLTALSGRSLLPLLVQGL